MDLGANQISVAERILSLQDEWDQIAASPDTVSLTPVQRAELDKRITDHASSPTDVVPWEDVLRNLRQR